MASRTIVPVGRLQVATPASMALAVRNATDARDAVDERIQGVAADIIANDPTIIAAAVAAAGDAVDDALNAENITRAYPETAVTQSTLASVPMYWTHKTLSAPYPAAYPDVYPGSWVGSARRRGDVPVLDTSGRIRDAQLPPTAARLSDIPTVPDIPEVIDTAPDRVITRALPILAARLSAAKVAGQPLPIVFAGSSTTRATPGFVTPLGGMLQETWRGVVASPVQYSATAEFEERSAAGVHIYNAGVSGTTALNFLDDAESDRIAALKPALIAIMVGSNDWRQGQLASTFKTNLTNRLNYIQGKLIAPCQIVVVHQYERRDGTTGSEPWSAYRTALEEISEAFDDVVFHDIADAYYAVGVPTPDPLSIISSDDIHQTATGYAFMVQVFAAFYFAA